MYLTLFLIHIAEIVVQLPVAPGENVIPNLFSMINFIKNLVIHFYSLLGNLGFNSREKVNFRQ